MGKTAANKDDAWKLIEFLGGKDKSGQYYTAAHWTELQGLGPGYTPVLESPKVVADTSKWVDTTVAGKMAQEAIVREISKATWYPEADLVLQQQVQKALLRQAKPREALAAAADKIRDIKKKA